MPLTDAQIIVIGGISRMGLAIAEAATERGTRVAVGGSRKDSVDRAINRMGPWAEEFAPAAVRAMANGYLGGAVTGVDGGGLLG